MVNWTEKRVERLKLLHEEGLSASVIAKKLGPDFTIGMVAGKIRRLGLTTKLAKKRPSVKAKPAVASKPAMLGSANARQSKPSRSAHAPITVPPAVPPRPMPAPAGPITGLRLYDLREGHCRWPVGEEKPAQFFCGAPALPSKSWCEHHYRMAYGHGPAHQNRVRERSSGLLRALREHAKSRHVETAQRVTKERLSGEGRGIPGSPHEAA